MSKTTKTVVERVETLRTALSTERAQAWEDALRLADATDIVSESNRESALRRVDELDQRLERIPKLEVREPDIYDRGSHHSFIKDLASLTSPVPIRGTEGALDRLTRHDRHEREIRQARGGDGIAQAALRGMGIECRDATGQELSLRALSTSSVA